MRQTLAALLTAAVSLPAFQARAALDFEKDVRPLLAGSCFKCHSGSNAKKGFQMDKPDEIIKKIGPDGYIVPGKPAQSEVIHRISLPLDDPDRMPPPNRGVKALSEDQVKVVAQWILEGASVGGAAPAPATATPAADPKALQQWQRASGGPFPAYFVKLEGANIVLRSESGQERSFPPEFFAPEAVELAKRLAAQP
ncbi:MAG: hypothetical protein KGS60_10870 [Verrucomicrobia bacterium]|nr:hypothetical protein [Verrucomicrobiota bacterium]